MLEWIGAVGNFDFDFHTISSAITMEGILIITAATLLYDSYYTEDPAYEISSDQIIESRSISTVVAATDEGFKLVRK